MNETLHSKLKSLFAKKNNFTYTNISFSVEQIKDNLKTQLKSLGIQNNQNSILEVKALDLPILIQKVINSSKEDHNKVLGILQIFYLAILNHNENFLNEFLTNEDNLFDTWGTYILLNSTLKLLNLEIFKKAISRKSITIIVLESKTRKYQIEVIGSVNHLLKSFESFIDEKESNKNDLKYFYRGHSDSTYTNTPGVFRGTSIQSFIRNSYSGKHLISTTVEQF